MKSSFCKNLNLDSKPARELMYILKQKRPHGSATEKAFVEILCKKIPGLVQDEFGNCIITIGKDDPFVCFSSHTDTVHRISGTQTVVVDAEIGMAYKDDGECLGADDGTGMWLMIQMIRAEIPGLYIFHRGEEVGGLGSKWIVANTPEILAGIDYCVAFDRKGYSNIITHQRGQRCCSQEFADSLSEQLEPMKFAADPTGSFTDSANYTDLIPECTNLSVGYFNQHSQNEYQDLGFLADFVRALKRVEWGDLAVARSLDPEPKMLGYKEIQQLVYNDPMTAIEVLLGMNITTQDIDDADQMLSMNVPGLSTTWNHLL